VSRLSTLGLDGTLLEINDLLKINDLVLPWTGYQSQLPSHRSGAQLWPFPMILPGGSQPL
jgi:hypothetical protein